VRKLKESSIETAIQIEDSELYHQIGAADRRRAEEAFMELFRRHGSRAVEYATRLMGGDQAKGEDIAQMVWEKIVTIAPQNPRVTHFRAWLLTVVRHTAFRALKKFSNKNELLESKPLDDSEEFKDHPDTQQITVETILVNRVSVQRLYELIDGLPDLQRLAILGWMAEDVSQAELADSLGVSYTGLGVLIHRAKKALEQALQQEARLESQS